MALTKILPKIFLGLGSIGLATSASYYVNSVDNNQEISTIPQTNVITKNIKSPFFGELKPKQIIELLKGAKWETYLLATTSIGSFYLVHKMGLGNIMYATRNQLKNGVSLINTTITTFKQNFDAFKKKILGDVKNLDKKRTFI